MKKMKGLFAMHKRVPDGHWKYKTTKIRKLLFLLVENFDLKVVCSLKTFQYASKILVLFDGE